MVDQKGSSGFVIDVFKVMAQVDRRLIKVNTVDWIIGVNYPAENLGRHRYGVCPPDSVPAPSIFAHLLACLREKSLHVPIPDGYSRVWANSSPARATGCYHTGRRWHLTEFEVAGHGLVVIIVVTRGVCVEDLSCCCLPQIRHQRSVCWGDVAPPGIHALGSHWREPKLGDQVKRQEKNRER
jgi:hypothetical protein